MAQAVPFIIMAVASLASSAVAAKGELESGEAQQEAAEYNAQVDEEDAVAAEKKAIYEEGIQRDRVRNFLSQQRAAIGKSGVSVAGSPLLALLDTRKQGELDALAIRQGGQTQASRLRSQAAQTRKTGQAAMKASRYRAGSSLLTGISQAAGSFSKMKGSS